MQFLQARGIGKSFPGVRALHSVDLHVDQGEVLALIGENGAGKSTLMKILAGIQLPDEGEISVDGTPVRIDSPRRATELGIALIHQELNLCDNLSVAANIFLGREAHQRGIMDLPAIERGAREALEQIGLDVDPSTPLSTLSIAQQQMVEIAKALSTRARIIVMDEPTSSLTNEEATALFSVIGELRQRGVAIIYISHRLGEISALADRVCVLRDGENAGQLLRDEIDRERMVALMVGRDVDQFYARTVHAPGEVALKVDHLIVPEWPQHALSFSIRYGEIVGIAGLVGAGRTELLQVLFGIEPALGGTMNVGGQRLSPRTPRDAIRAGLSLLPEDRKLQGLVTEMSIRHNISLPGLRIHARSGAFIDLARETSDSEQAVKQLSIRTPDIDQQTRYLSGGNQQKVVLGKWLALNPNVLLLDEPTRGVDVGAKEEIYRLMEQLAGEGVAILFASSEMEEILGMADRALVMHEGRITGQLQRDQLSEESIMHLATGRAA
ncbi:MAG: sugar ABC transporter ATP-binding protein [Candidatus Latescibacterota bacterium]|nr:sugar ABC transporter ATP-binding protein [Candidatus Latescibacterota bacterium]